MVDIVKVNIPEEEVSLDIFRVSLSGTQSSRRITCEQLRYDQLGIPKARHYELTLWRRETASLGIVIG